MKKWRQLTQQILGWRWPPAAPAGQPPTAEPAAPAAPVEAPAEVPPLAEKPMPPWRVARGGASARFVPRIVSLPEEQGYVLLRFYSAECRRTLMMTRKAPLRQGMVCLSGPLFAMGDVQEKHACEQGASMLAVPRCFRFVLPPILYATMAEMEAILMQTHQEAARLLENGHSPVLPESPSMDLMEPIPDQLPEQLPPDWADYPPLDVPTAPPEMEAQAPGPKIRRPEPRQSPNVGGRSGSKARVRKEWTGTIIKFEPKGRILINGEEKPSPVLWFHDEALGGGKNSVSGKHLLEAMALSQASPGDRVNIRHMENVPVEVDQHGGRQGRRPSYMKLYEIDVLEKWQPPGE